MKKILALILCVCMLTSLGVCFAQAAEASVTITIASDLHYNLKASSAEKVSKRNNISEDFFHAATTGDLPAESLAVIKAFLAKAAADESDYVLLAGDLVSSGTQAEHQAMAAMLKEFEASSGKAVFVVPGNHDFYGVTPDEFVSLYKDFGYSQAIAKDTLSYSYVVELKNNYRLLVIDSTDPGEGEHGMTKERVNWVRTQAEKAKKDGKYLIVSMHHNLLERVSAASFIHEADAVDQSLGLSDVLADNGVKYVFSGHSHIQDITSYTSKNGNTLYEVVTGCLSASPVPYRVVSFGTETEIETRQIDKIDTSLVPSGMTDKAFSLMSTDFVKYAKASADAAMIQLVRGFVTAESLKQQLQVDEEKHPEIGAIVDKVAQKAEAAMRFPLYKRHETTQGESIQSILEKYDVLMPETDCRDMHELSLLFYQAHAAGDENYPVYSHEVFAFTRGLAAVMNYSLADVTGEEYAEIMSYLTSLSGFTIHSGFFIYAGDGVKRFEGIEVYIATVVTPVISQYTKDDAPADNNAVLEGYEPVTEPAEELTPWEKFVNFLKRIYDYLMSIFTYYDK